jgi:peptidoglycan hydrolase CwlO-like protein
MLEWYIPFFKETTMATNMELEKKVASLEKQLDEMRSAIRAAAEQSNSLLDMLLKSNEQIQQVKSDLGRVKNSIPPPENRAGRMTR